MKSRYIFCPMTAKRIGRRSSWLARIRRNRAAKRGQPDLFRVTGFNAPVYPGK